MAVSSIGKRHLLLGPTGAGATCLSIMFIIVVMLFAGIVVIVVVGRQRCCLLILHFVLTELVTGCSVPGGET
jgi:hypothetical protein